MAANDKDLKKAKGGLAAPQHYNEKIGDYEYVQGEDGASFVTVRNPIPPGSNYESILLTVTPTPQVVTFVTAMSTILVTNDGTDDIKMGLQGHDPVGLVHDNLDAKWTYSGTWATESNVALRSIGPDSTKTGTAGSKATYIPSISSWQIGVGILRGSASGIAQIEISSDGGNTWVNPSTISGIGRADGATGTALDMFDTYTLGVSGVYDLMYTMPSSAAWAIRVSYTGSKSGSSSGTMIWLDYGRIYTSNARKTIIIKPNETKIYNVRTSDARLASTTGAQSVRLEGIS